MKSTINKYLIQIADIAKGAGKYAYRGQQNSQWLLYSAAIRRLIGEHSDEIIDDPDFSRLYIDYHHDILLDPARMRGFGSKSGHSLSDLELLSKLQHFGAETALLDFTWNPLVALWFACEDENCDGKIFVIDSNNPLKISKMPIEKTAQKLADLINNDSMLYWEPPVTKDASIRTLRQRSVFIIGQPQLFFQPDIFIEIVIAKDDKKALRRELDILDFNKDSLFQDFYGFIQVSREKYISPLLSKEYYRRGNKYYQEKKYLEAIRSYGKYIECTQNNGKIYLLRANAFAAVGRHEEAVRDYDKAEEQITQLEGMQDTVYFNRGNSKVELEDYEGALKDYKKSIKINSEHSGSYYNRGNTYADLYRFEEAIYDYDKVTGYSAMNATFNKGNAFLGMGQLSKAERCYTDVFTQDENHAGASQNLHTLKQIYMVIRNQKYKIDTTPGSVTIILGGDENATAMRMHPQVFIFRGRVGNKGNTGGPGLSGGEGFEGKSGIRIHVTAQSEDSM